MAFDVNQQENRIDLDKYGVWVKKAPRNIEEEVPVPENTAPMDGSVEEMAEISEPAADASPIDDFESMALEETAELPSFVDQEETPAIQDEDEIPLETFIDTDFLDDFTNDISGLLEDDEINKRLPPAEEEQADSHEEFTVPEESAEQENILVPEENSDVPDEKLSITGDSTSPAQNFAADEKTSIIGEETDEFQADNEEEGFDLDEFLSDSDEIDLEDFMDTPVQEQSDILDEIPIDMNLNFDDDFAADTEAGPGGQMEENITTDSQDDFDQMFDNIIDEAEVQPEKFDPEASMEEPRQDLQCNEVSDFDDLLDELSDPKDTKNKYEAPKDFDMEIAKDDDEKPEPVVSQLEDDETENMEKISLAMDNTEKTNENRNSSLDSLQISDYTETDYISDDDFDIDKIMSEVEDIGDMTPEILSRTEPETAEEPTFDDVQVEESQDTAMEMPEEAMEFNQNEMEQPAGSRTEELISNIASEIALLRDEIANLKHEFEVFKSGQTTPSYAAAKPEPQESPSSGGFFADSSDDDTIALSGDELSNIFNTADFTEESVDAEIQKADDDSSNSLPPMDFDSENLEEPVIDDNYFDDEEISELPNEIDVPTSIVPQQDEIFEEIDLDGEEMESQDPVSDMDETFDTAAGEQTEKITDGSTSDDETIEEIEPASVFDDKRENQEENTEEPIEEVETEEPSNEEFIQDYTQDAVETVGLDSVEEEISEEPEQEVAETHEDFEEEISDDPTEVVFESSQWDTPIDDTTGLADIPAIDSSDEEEAQSDISSLDDDSLIIEEDLDIVSVAEEELLEELEEIPVSDDDLDNSAALQQETVEQESVGQTPGIDTSDTEEVSVEEEEVQVTEDEPIAESRCGDDTDLNEEATTSKEISEDLKNDIKSVLVYMDQLLDSLPEEKIAEFARSEHFELYKKLFTELGLS